MKMIRRIGISLSITLLTACMGALLLFNWSVTGWKALTVTTGSMRPSIPVGSLVLMHRVPITSLKVGDVITYTNLSKPGTTITHRIVETYKMDGKIPAFITKGDSNQTVDKPIVGGQVLGKSVWHAPHLGGWINQMKKPYILLPIVYIPALFIMIEEIRRLSEYYKKQIPYRVFGYDRPKGPKVPSLQLLGKVATTAKMSLAIVIVASFVAPPIAKALLKSNTVALANNSIIIAPQPNQCPTGSNSTNTTININGNGGNNNVNVNSSTNQNATTGNATSSGGGSATSGNASNTSCTNINVTITNNH